MKPVDPTTKQRLLMNKKCVICYKTLGKEKHLDHNHYTGEPLGYAHPSCNMERRTPKSIPIFFHNLRGYDSHLIIDALARREAKGLRVIPKSIENYAAIITDKFRFIDSYAHLPSSIDTLVKNLKTSGTTAFAHLRHFINSQYGADPVKLALLLRKGVYPYTYFDSMDRFKETQLPPREAFYNDLKEEECSEEDYIHAQNVWTLFHMKTLQDYHDLYLKSDVLLLSCIIDQYRKECYESYGLDPTHYYTSPSLTWDAGLKFCKVKLELLQDEGMYMFMEQAIRGGISTVTHRHAKANNKFLPDYDSSQPSSFLLYIDANNLYGWAMRQKLPIGSFEWVKFISINDILNYDMNGDIGYFIECDIIIPNDVHEYLNDLPPCPESLVINEELISNVTKEARRARGVTVQPEQKKLAPNFLPKTRYKVHIANLKKYMLLGAEVVKIYRVLKFRQKNWLASYIDFNTLKRQQSTSEFGKSFYKLMINSYFGKTMESVRKRRNIVLIRTEGEHRFQTSKPSFRRFKIFNENLVAAELFKPCIELDRPIYVGATILDLSKHLMYDFWYEKLKVKFSNIKLCFTDTDSLLFWVESENIYKDMYEMRQYFDTSNYGDFTIDENKAKFIHDYRYYLFSNDRKAVPGLFKDEAKGKVIKEFIGLRSKMYSVDILDDERKMATAGVKTVIAKQKLMHKNFREVLLGGKEVTVEQKTIRSFQHKLFTIKQRRAALSAIDDKRYILDDKISTRALGHYLN